MRRSEKQLISVCFRANIQKINKEIGGGCLWLTR